METLIKNHGLIIPRISTRKEGAEHVLGSLSEQVINPSGDWMPIVEKVVKETQLRKGIETNACTVHTISNAEDILKEALGEATNSSERYLANVAKNNKILDPARGADPHIIAEMRRNQSGSISEKLVPWLNTIASVDEYYSLSVTPLFPEAVKEYKKWIFNHKWIWTSSISPQEKRARIKDALTKGIVGVSGLAWVYDSVNKYYIKPSGTIDGHNFIIVQAKDDLPYKAFDSYAESEGDLIKDLDPLYDFAIAKVYFLTRPPQLFLKNLYFQTQDAEVIELQRALISFGYKIPLSVTTLFGVQTRDALALFQKANGIVDNGTHFGPKTRNAMNVKLNPDTAFGGSVVTFIHSLFSGV